MGLVQLRRNDRPSADAAGVRPARSHTDGARHHLAARRAGAAPWARRLSACWRKAPPPNALRPPRRRRKRPRGRPVQSIVALVNDEPITGYEIEQRVTLAMLGAPGRAAQAAGETQIAEHERAVQGLRHEAAAGQPAQDGGGAAGARQAVAGRVRRQHEGAGREGIRADGAQAGARRADRRAPEAAGGQAPQHRRPPTTRSTASSAAWPSATR